MIIIQRFESWALVQTFRHPSYFLALWVEVDSLYLFSFNRTGKCSHFSQGRVRNATGFLGLPAATANGWGKWRWCPPPPGNLPPLLEGSGHELLSSGSWSLGLLGLRQACFLQTVWSGCSQDRQTAVPFTPRVCCIWSCFPLSTWETSNICHLHNVGAFAA